MEVEPRTQPCPLGKKIDFFWRCVTLESPANISHNIDKSQIVAENYSQGMLFIKNYNFHDFSDLQNISDMEEYDFLNCCFLTQSFF